MKIKNPDNEKYFKAGLTAFCVVAAGLVLFFAMFRSHAIGQGAGRVVAILKPFIYGAVIAYILTPFCNRFRNVLLKAFGGKREKLAEALSIVIAVAIALVLVTLLVLLVVPQLVESINQLAEAMPGRIEAAGKKAEQIAEENPKLLEFWEVYGETLQNKLEYWTENSLPGYAQKVLGNAALYVQRTAVALKNLVLGVLISLYILISRKRFAAQAKLLLHAVFAPRAARAVEKEVRYADRMFNGFLVGKIIDSFIIGLLCFIGCSILRFESPLLIAVIVGVTNIIPFFGPFIGAIPCALMLLISHPIQALYFVIFVVALQQLDGNVIGPKILGDTTGLSSFWVLFSILLFGGLWGIPGMIIGVPLFAVFYDIVRQLVKTGLGKHGRSAMADEYDEAFHPGEAEEAKKSRWEAGV
ncbi:MAG: AI-2E family transporter [Clostridia bacterium]|nr:AI-2E family transporter [Clostridia bacterium]